MIAVCPIVGLDARGAARIWPPRQASPCELQLGADRVSVRGRARLRPAGPAVYFGKLVEKPTIGDASREIEWGRHRTGDKAHARRVRMRARRLRRRARAVVLAVGAMA